MRIRLSGSSRKQIDQMVMPSPRSKRAGLYFIAPALVYLLAVTIVPTVLLIRYAFSSWRLGSFNPDAGIDFVGFETFARVLGDSTTIDNFWATGSFVFWAVLIELLLGLLIALALVNSFRGATLVRTLLIAPVIVAPIGVGFVWRYILHPDVGILNWALGGLGLIEPNWLGAKPWAMWSIVIADVWQWTPFVMLILLAGLIGIPQSLYEAARIDGATRRQQFLHITLPLLLPTIAIALALRFIWAMKTFDTIYAMTRGGPGNYTTILNVEIYKQAFQIYDTSFAAALSVLVLLLTIVITRGFLMRSKEGEQR